MNQLPSTDPILAATVIGGAVLAWRVRETRVQLPVKTVVIPPAAMSSAIFMFLTLNSAGSGGGETSPGS